MSIRAFGLAILTVLMAMALVNVPSAMGEETALCSADEKECAEPIEHVHEATLSGAKAIILASPKVECDVLFLGDAYLETGEPLLISGNLTYSNCGGCTVTEENGPAEIEVLKEGHELAIVTGVAEFHVNCFGLNCYYNFEGLKGTAKGPLLASNENGEVSVQEQSLNKVKGIFCPSTVKLDITTTPLEPTFIASEPLPVEPKEEEKEGECNPALVERVSCLIAKPVDPASGNMTDSQVDVLALGGRGPALGVTRSYNSRLASRQTKSGPFGYGWTGPYSASLEFDAGGAIAIVHQDNGATATFYKKEGKYAPPGWGLASLKASGENWVFTLPTQEALEFNKSGQLAKVTDRHKNSLTLTYKEGNLETVEDAAKRKLTFTFKEGKVESVKDPLGNTVKYAYESDNLTKVTLPGETEPNWKFKYDASHQMTEATDGRGNTTTTEFDGSNRVKAQKDALERKHSFEYKEKEGVKETTITMPNGSKTVEKYNAMGEPTETVKASGTELAQTTKYKYNSAYQLTELTDPNGHVLKYDYDSEGNKASEKDANENESKWEYNSTHDVTSETTPVGNKPTITRNASGDPETLKRPRPAKKPRKRNSNGPKAATWKKKPIPWATRPNTATTNTEIENRKLMPKATNGPGNTTKTAA